jgi:hypothetical protein
MVYVYEHNHICISIYIYIFTYIYVSKYIYILQLNENAVSLEFMNARNHNEMGVWSTAAGQRGKQLNGSKNLYLKANARSWH